DTAAVTAHEQALILQVTEEHRARLKGELEAILVQLGAAPAEVATMPPQDMTAAIHQMAPAPEVQRARRQIARERAGLDPPLQPRTPTERFEALMANVGDAHEEKLARVLGAGRAAELRAVRDGWGASTVAGGECD